MKGQRGPNHQTPLSAKKNSWVTQVLRLVSPKKVYQVMTMSGRSDRNTFRTLCEPNPAPPRTFTHLRKENNSLPWTPLALMHYLLLSSGRVINRGLIDDHFSNSLLLTPVSIQGHQTLHRHEGWYLLPSAPPARDGFPEMLHFTSPGRRVTIKVSSQFQQIRKPMHSYFQVVWKAGSTPLIEFLWAHFPLMAPWISCPA